ncbi:MAG: NAD(+) diphosphatase [Planctomycetota bacterium]|jgi:NAD+ diphosphatase|nr:NAD(+) diphosphatase [Planctomycetota bacterium]
MLQDIQPRRFDIAFKRRPAVDADRVAILDPDGKILLSEKNGEAFLPALEEIRALAGDGRLDLHYLFSIDDTAFHHHPGSVQVKEGGRFRYVDFQDFRNFGESWRTFAGVTAGHIAQWYRNNRFCGACGTPTAAKENERALVCPSCSLVVYPRISPAVIVAVVDGDKLLLTVYANRNYRRLALVAGFMEVGETVEDTVRREVFEEVGIRVKNVRYYKSQPWAFSGSVLMGFFAELDGSPDITLDEAELGEAGWFAREDIPPNDSVMSLTSTMIEAFRNREFPA